jgi:hypothetical protein
MRKTLAALCGFFIACGIAQAQSGIGTLTAAGADCTTVGACVSVNFSSTDNGSASIQLSGTFNATVQFEASSDNGTTWVAISGTPLNSTTAVTSATTANTWKFNVASLTSIRARCSAFTSAPTVVIHTSKAVANAIGGGAVYASGNGTINVIPKGNGAGQLSNSSITDDGTTVTTTEIVVAPTIEIGTNPGVTAGTINIPNSTYFRGRNAANSADIAAFRIDTSNHLSLAGSGGMVIENTVGSVNSVTTAGTGIPLLRASSRSTAQAAAVASVATVTPTADTSLLVSANVLVTTATTHSFTVTCAYTDEGNTARTVTLPFVLVAGSAIVNTIANAAGAVPYMGIPIQIRAKASTAVTIATTGTFTTVAYNVEGTIQQVN